jgi:hypothetical protein
MLVEAFLVLVSQIRSANLQANFFQPIKIDSSQIPVSFEVPLDIEDRGKLAGAHGPLRSTETTVPVVKPLEFESASNSVSLANLEENKDSEDEPIIRRQESSSPVISQRGRFFEQENLRTPLIRAKLNPLFSPIRSGAVKLPLQAVTPKIEKSVESNEQQQQESLRPPLTRATFNPLFSPIGSSAVKIPLKETMKNTHTFNSLHTDEATAPPVDLTTPGPEVSVIQGFKVVGSLTNKVVYLDLNALKASGLDFSDSSTILIGSMKLEPIDGLSTGASTADPVKLPPIIPSVMSLTAASSIARALGKASQSPSIGRLRKTKNVPLFFSKFDEEETVRLPINNEIKPAHNLDILKPLEFSHFPVKNAAVVRNTPDSPPNFGDVNSQVKGAHIDLEETDPFAQLEALKNVAVVKNTPDSPSSISSPDTFHSTVKVAPIDPEETDPIAQLEALKRSRAPGYAG